MFGFGAPEEGKKPEVKIGAGGPLCQKCKLLVNTIKDFHTRLESSLDDASDDASTIYHQAVLAFNQEIAARHSPELEAAALGVKAVFQKLFSDDPRLFSLVIGEFIALRPKGAAITHVGELASKYQNDVPQNAQTGVFVNEAMLLLAANVKIAGTKEFANSQLGTGHMHAGMIWAVQRSLPLSAHTVLLDTTDAHPLKTISLFTPCASQTDEFDRAECYGILIRLADVSDPDGNRPAWRQLGYAIQKGICSHYGVACCEGIDPSACTGASFFKAMFFGSPEMNKFSQKNCNIVNKYCKEIGLGFSDASCDPSTEASLESELDVLDKDVGLLISQ